MPRVLRNDPIPPSPPLLFLNSSTGSAGIIHEGCDASRYSGLFQAAHALKSASAMMGALALSDFAKDLEQMGRQGKVSKPVEDVQT